MIFNGNAAECLVGMFSPFCPMSYWCLGSLAKEDQVNENAQYHHGHDYLLQAFRIKRPRRNCPRCGSTMTAMMIGDGKRVTAGGARLQWHMIPIADIELIARNTRGEENGVACLRKHGI